MPPWLQNLLSEPSVITLMSGGGVFLLTFIGLQWTRWGDDKPVAKCVILSVVAHVVLLVYAYSLSWTTPLPEVLSRQVVPIRVAVPSEEAELEAVPDPDLVAEQPLWEKLAEAELSPAETLETVPPQETNWEIERMIEAQDADPTVALSDPANSPPPTTPWLDTPAEADSTNPALDALLQPTPVSAEVVAMPPPAVAAAASDLPVPPEAAATDSPPDPATENPPSLEQALLDMAQQELGLERQLAEDDPLVDQWVEGQRENSGVEASSLPDALSETDLRQRLDQLQAEAAQAAMDVGSDAPLFDPRSIPQPWLPADRQSAQAAHAAQIARRPLPRRPADQQPLPALYHKRLERPLPEVELAGGSADTEQSVARGLAFLATLQKSDGSWNPRETGGGREQQVLGHNRQGAGAQADTGITGLALLAFLADGNTHLGGAYQETVRRGLEYLIQRQQRGGSLAGSAQYYAQMYCHSMALLALSEAFALTGDERLRPSVQAGVTYSLDTQNRAGGGWRYQPQEAGDMSQFGWQVMALRGAGLNGVATDENSRRLMQDFLQRHSRGNHQGLAIYRLGEPTSPTMTAEALFCRYLMGQAPSVPQVEEACLEILGLPSETLGSGPQLPIPWQACRQLPGRNVDNLYFWYYASLALRQAASDPALAHSELTQQSWELWNRNLTTRLLSLQRSDGPWSGSWDPEACLWGGYGGRVYTTSLAVLCLQVYYRYDLTREEAPLTAAVPWAPAPLGPTPPPQRGPATGSIRDWR